MESTELHRRPEYQGGHWTWQPTPTPKAYSERLERGAREGGRREAGWALHSLQNKAIYILTENEKYSKVPLQKVVTSNTRSTGLLLCLWVLISIFFTPLLNKAI